MLRARQFNRVDVESEQMAFRCDVWQDGAGVSAVTESAVDGELPGARLQDLEDFTDHDGNVCAGGGFAGSENLRDGLGMPVRIEFLVFLLEAARMRSRVAGTTAMRRGCGFVHGLSRSRHCGGEIVPLFVGLFEFLG